MDTIDRQSLSSITSIPYFYLETQNSAVMAVIIIATIIVIFLSILAFKGLITFKSTLHPKIFLEISMNRIYPLILPMLFSYYTTSVFGCIMALIVMIACIATCILAYRDYFDQETFNLCWMCMRLLNLAYWFGICIHVFFEFT